MLAFYGDRACLDCAMGNLPPVTIRIVNNSGVELVTDTDEIRRKIQIRSTARWGSIKRSR